MKNSDLNMATQMLNEYDLAMCIVKDGVVIYKSKERGIYPMYMATITLSDELLGASLADKVIGKAAAMLCIKSGIGAVYAKVISQPAIDILRDIETLYKKKVTHILNRDKTDYCPMEKLSMKTNNVDELLCGIEKFLKEIGMLHS